MLRVQSAASRAKRHAAAEGSLFGPQREARDNAGPLKIPG